jgi:hypothetical protein
MGHGNLFPTESKVQRASDETYYGATLIVHAPPARRTALSIIVYNRRRAPPQACGPLSGRYSHGARCGCPARVTAALSAEDKVLGGRAVLSAGPQGGE